MVGINITDEQKQVLHAIRLKLKERFKRPVYYSEVISHLLENTNKLDKLKIEVDRLRGVIEDIAKKPSFFGGIQQSSVSHLSPPSFSPPPQLPPPKTFTKPVQFGVKKGEERVLGSEDTRKMLMREMNEIFSKGVKLKPVNEAIAEDISEGVITIETVTRILSDPDKGIREIMVEYIMLVRQALKSKEVLENIDEIFNLEVLDND